MQGMEWTLESNASRESSFKKKWTKYKHFYFKIKENKLFEFDNSFGINKSRE